MTNAMISSEEAQSYQSKGLSPRRRTYEVGMRGLLYLSAGITCLLLLFLIGYILYRGLPNLNWTFLTSQESVLRGTDGIMPAIQNTLYVIVVTLIFILPLGVGAAIYLTEYASNHKLVSAIEFATETLAGIPSILYALVGMLIFCQVMDPFNTKLKNAQKFIADGNRVKVSVRFRGREMAHTDIGRDLLNQFAEQCAEVAVLDKTPKLEGRMMSIFLSPKTGK